MFQILNKFARLASARSEVVGASLVLLMVAMMVIPLSPAVLDVLLAMNISAAILLAISAVLIESPLAFSSFPAILLMTTLFRLSLTISTTRQILLEGDAGHIVQTFGEFVVGGNVAVGLTVFIIISVVNFLVVTKGSERIAEVAARFSLDGMPGKQMSIDSDLRAGLINQTTAKLRRSNLEKESQMFGAMDGAIKFVKNDAIAGLVITLINLLGGLAVGMLQKDMSFGEAGHAYTILSVGDGLVAIIPSLLVSVAAGLIVTRVTKSEGDAASSTAADMFKDLSRNANALQISGVFCLLFAFVPGMPTMVFLMTSVGFLTAWFFVSKKEDKPEPVDVSNQFTDLLSVDHNRAFEDVTTTDTYAPLEIRIPKSVEPNIANQLQNICRIARNRQVEHLGIVLPLFGTARHDEVYAELYIFGVPALTLDLSERRISVLEPIEKLQQVQDLVVTEEKDKVTGRTHYLCEPLAKPLLDQNEFKYQTYETRLLEQVEAVLVKKIHQMFNLNEYQRHLTALGDRFAEQLKELDRVLPSTKVVEVLQKLMAEKVSIKNLRTIFNSLIEWGQRERDVDVITEQVRRSLHEQICYQHAVSKRMRVFLLGVEFEQLIRESIRSQGSNSYLDIDASSLNELVEMVERQCKPYLYELTPPAIVCSMDCRMFFRQIIEQSLFCVPVLSHQEVSSNLEIQVLGNINIDESHQLN